MATQGVDPLMKRIYIGVAAVAVLLLLLCGCYFGCRGSSEVATRFKCTKPGCLGEKELKHPPNKVPPAPS